MLYHEAGQFKTSFAADQAILPLREDRVLLLAVLVVAFVVVPAIGNDYWLGTILTPLLIYALAAIGLNLLTGYAGQLSLGTGGFMAVGAFAAYNLAVRFPWLNIVVVFALSGVITAVVGIVFGLPSFRIKGFYLAVSTLAAQFFLVWLFTTVGWFSDYAPSGVIAAPPITLFGHPLATSASRYLLTLFVVAVLAVAARNLVRGNVGRCWMAVRDMDVAAEVIGVRLLPTKLLAFAVSSFYVGIAGALLEFIYLRQMSPDAFGLELSFQVLFMILIGGLGSILGSFIGAAFILLVPVLFSNLPSLLGLSLGTALAQNFEDMIFGALIVLFLIVEPYGLARLLHIAKQKLRSWPFPY